MKTKIFKNLKELKPYYNKELNTYDFTKFDLIEFEFNLNVKSNIKAMNIKALDIYTNNINAQDIDAWNIKAMDINAMDIKAWNIDARNIDTDNINAWNINAFDIKAMDINAVNIDASNIDARNISYYAVCFAYNNIKCKSIEGRRPNSKHFVLDGKIEVLENEKELED